MTGDPDLAGGEVEVQEVVDCLSREKAADLMRDHFSTDVYHLDEGHVVAFLVVPNTNIVLLVKGNALFEVFEGGGGVLLFVVGARELEALVCFKDLKEIRLYERSMKRMLKRTVSSRHSDSKKRTLSSKPALSLTLVMMAFLRSRVLFVASKMPTDPP